ncbi:MAG TPA: lipid-A-disaccharide synthase [bacterium]|nr:lipid-A-disaccharide synthase [bacterium]
MGSKEQKKILMVAGEVSGDLHAAKVAEALLRKDKGVRLFGLGGPRMAAAGVEVREDLTKDSAMGFAEVVRQLPASLRRLKDCERWMAGERPDLLVLVDYPGFNLRLAARAHAMGIPVCYYIAPKVWAWNASRLKVMAKVLKKLLVIFPFEAVFFKKHRIPAVFVGNPSVEEMDLKPVARKEVLASLGLKLSQFPLVCAMPGSRRGEIGKIWPLFLKASRLLRKTCPDAAFVVPMPPGLTPGDFHGVTPDDPFYFVEGPAYDVRKACDLAWIKSGTSTLETALLKTPMVVVYKVAMVTGFLAKRFLKIKDVSLVNILAGRTVVTELLQEKAKPARLVAETNRLLDQRSFREGQLKAFAGIHRAIARPAKASEKAAVEILKLLKSGEPQRTQRAQRRIFE